MFPATPRLSLAGVLLAGAISCAPAATILMDYDDGIAGNGIHEADISGGGFDDTSGTTDALTFADHTVWTTTGAATDQASRTNIADNGDKTDGSVRSSVLTATRVFLASTVGSGYAIREGDTYQLDFVWRDAANWAANGVVTIQIGYLGTPGDLTSFTEMAAFTTEPRQAAGAWEAASSDFEGAAAPASAAGETLYVRMTATSGFGRADNITLLAIPEPSVLGLLAFAALGLRRRR